MVTLIAEFLAHLSLERRLSAHTCRAYGTDLGQFREFLETRWGQGSAAATPEKVSRDDIRAFLGYLNASGFGRRSIARKLASLRAFMGHLCRAGRLEQNPALYWYIYNVLIQYLGKSGRHRHFKGGLNGGIIVITSITTNYQCFSLKAFECAKDRLHDVFKVVWLLEYFYFFAQSGSAWALVVKRSGLNIFYLHGI